MNPTLYLIPSPLGKEFHPDAFPNEIKSIIEKLDYFIVENEKINVIVGNQKVLKASDLQKTVHDGHAFNGIQTSTKNNKNNVKS